MIPALCNRGFGYGSGIVDPDNEIFIVNIPKNASSYVLSWAQCHGWRATLAEHAGTVKEMVVLLRDPVQRWISGMAQYVNTYILSVRGPNGPVFPDEAITKHDYTMDADMFIKQYTDLTERLIFDNASRLDDHVWPQREIVQDLLPGVTRRYFRVDHELNSKLAQHLGWRMIDNLDHNAGHNNPNIKMLQEFFQQRLRDRPELQTRLVRHYAHDYDLLSRAFA